MRDREQAIRLLWDAINDEDDWGSITDVRKAVDAILALPVVVTEEMVVRAKRAFYERVDPVLENMRAALEAALNGDNA